MTGEKVPARCSLISPGDIRPIRCLLVCRTRCKSLKIGRVNLRLLVTRYPLPTNELLELDSQLLPQCSPAIQSTICSYGVVQSDWFEYLKVTINWRSLSLLFRPRSVCPRLLSTTQHQCCTQDKCNHGAVPVYLPHHVPLPPFRKLPHILTDKAHVFATCQKSPGYLPAAVTTTLIERLLTPTTNKSIPAPTA